MFTCEVEEEDQFVLGWLRRVVRPVNDGLRRAVNMAATEGADEARTKHQFENRTGDLERSIEAKTDLTTTADSFASEIVAGKNYASFVENGTKPHVIAANRARSLHFIWKDTPVFFRYVNHPGTKPRVFMGLAYLKAERVLQREVEVSLLKAQEALDS